MYIHILLQLKDSLAFISYFEIFIHSIGLAFALKSTLSIFAKYAWFYLGYVRLIMYYSDFILQRQMKLHFKKEKIMDLYLVTHRVAVHLQWSGASSILNNLTIRCKLANAKLQPCLEIYVDQTCKQDSFKNNNKKLLLG